MSKQQLKKAIRDLKDDLQVSPHMWLTPKYWNEWGIGVDANNGWRLFHRRRGSNGARWVPHTCAQVMRFSPAIEKVARQFVDRGRIVVDASEAPLVRPQLTRLRELIERAIVKERCLPPKGNPIPFDRGQSCYWPVVNFGRIVRTATRHLHFAPSSFDSDEDCNTIAWGLRVTPMFENN
jgi:hypothetical protein